jgi:methionine-rich copper-binding protein CopC
LELKGPAVNNYRTTILGGGVAALLFISPAFGHAFLMSSSPTDKATVAPPKTIDLTFSDKLTTAFSGFDLIMPTMGGMKVGVTTSMSDDGKTITGTPKGTLTAGTYQINWHVVAADDGHRTQGKMTFAVK